MATATYNEASLTYDDADYVYDGMPESQGIAVLVGTLSAAEDVTPVLKWETLAATDGGNAAKGTVNLRLERAISALTTLTDQCLVRLIDLTEHDEAIRAIVTARLPVVLPGYTATDVVAEQVGALLDTTFIASEVRAAETMVARITALWGDYATTPLDLDDLTNVASIGSTLPAQNFVGVTLRQAIESTISQASSSADYYVDNLGKLHVFTSAAATAPYNIDADAPGVGEIAPHDLRIEYDSGSYANRVYIQGANPTGSGYYRDESAITAAGGMLRTAVLRAPDCTTAAMAQALANMYLGRVSSAVARGSFEATSPDDGWRTGQAITVTSSDHGLTAEAYRIHRVTTRLSKPGTDLRRRYTVEFGGSRAGGGGGAIADTLGSGQLVSGNLGGASNTYVTSDGVAVTDGSVVRARLGLLSSGEYGLEVINGDSTVILDGTSNMFKIAASGTQSSASGPNVGKMELTTDLETGLTSAPMHTGSAGFGYGLLPYSLLGNESTGDMTLVDHIHQHTEVVNTDQTRVTDKYVSSADRSSQNWSVKYFVFKEAAA